MAVLPLRERITDLDELGDLSAEPGSRSWAIAVRGKLVEHLHDTESNALALQEYRDAMVRYGGFRQLSDGIGRPFRSFESFCRERAPYGLGYDPHAIERIVEERKSAQARAQAPATLLDVGPPTKAERANNVVLHNIAASDMPQSDYLTARIARDHPAILEKMQAGEYPSVRAAALDAGIVKPRVSVPLDVESAARTLRKCFTREQLDALIALLEAE